MSAIRALGNGATSATPYASTQAGYDAAIADLTAAGGIIELSGGLETVNLGTIPANIVVLRFRTGATAPGLEIGASADISVGSTHSYRMVDSAGTYRTVLTALSDNTLRLAMLDNAKGIKFSNIAGAQVALLTSTTLDFQTLLSLSGDTGGTNKTILSQGASPPIWGFPAGLPGSTMQMMLTAPFWGNSISTATPGTGAYVYSVMSGATDNSNYCDYIVPSNFTATTSWQMYWTQPSADAGNCLHEFSMFKVGGAGFNFTTATFTAGATQTTAGPGATLLAITTMPTPAVTIAAGDKVILRIRRIGTPDPPDTNTVATHFIGMQHNYT